MENFTSLTMVRFVSKDHSGLAERHRPSFNLNRRLNLHCQDLVREFLDSVLHVVSDQESFEISNPSLLLAFNGLRVLPNKINRFLVEQVPELLVDPRELGLILQSRPIQIMLL